MRPSFDILIIGGGPAGLSAALIASRARLRTLLIDGGTPRNAAAPAMHSFVSRDGILPRDFRAASHAELQRYPTLQRREGLVDDIREEGDALTVTLIDGQTFNATRVLLALGLIDHLPELPGLRDHWGKGVHHCPFCDGFEHGDEPWGVLAEEPAMLEHSTFYRGWTSHITVFTQGHDFAVESVAALRDAGLRVESQPVTEVLGGDGHQLRGVMLADGRLEPVKSLWIRPRQTQTALVERLGLQLTEQSAIWRDGAGRTSRPGLFAAGDCAAGPMQQAILGAADGARTMFGMIHSLLSRSG